MKNLRFGDSKKRNSQHKVVIVKSFRISNFMNSYNSLNATETLKSIYGLN